MTTVSPPAVLRIGVVGYSGTPFDRERGRALLVDILDHVVAEHPADDYVLVSGLTDMGIPALAYREAARRGWKTVGVACKRARRLTCYPVDERILHGSRWGDESPIFLASIDVLAKVGGGRQSIAEYAAFTGPKYERELPGKRRRKS